MAKEKGQKDAAEVVEIVVDGKTIAVPMITRDFGGAVVASRYGDVEVRLGDGADERTYVVRVGAVEWWKAETVFGVKGDGAVIDAYKAAGEEGRLKFVQIALQGKHGEVALEDVGRLLDYHPEKGPSLEDAVMRALSYSRPERLAPRHPDPKALEVLRLALVEASPSESSIS